MLMGGTPKSVGSCLEMLSRGILAGIILVGRLGVPLRTILPSVHLGIPNLGRDNLSREDWAYLRGPSHRLSQRF